MTSRVPVTIVNHAAIDIAAAPDAVWREILDAYAEARKFRETHTVEPIDDPAAVLGGYRMRLEKDGVLLDDRIVHLTERDEAARRLSAFADYLSVPGGLQVFATYQVHEAPDGARYTLDCHTRMSLEAPAGAQRPELAEIVGKMKAQFDPSLDDYLQSVKAKLEAA